MNKNASLITAYTLNEKRELVPIKDLSELSFDREKFRVGYMRIFGTEVSTVFLSIDHSFRKEGKPVLWETMIFGGKHDQYQERYTSEADAIVGHRKAVRMVLLSPFEKLINWWKSLE